MAFYGSVWLNRTEPIPNRYITNIGITILSQPYRIAPCLNEYGLPPHHMKYVNVELFIYASIYMIFYLIIDKTKYVKELIVREIVSEYTFFDNELNFKQLP